MKKETVLLHLFMDNSSQMSWNVTRDVYDCLEDQFTEKGSSWITFEDITGAIISIDTSKLMSFVAEKSTGQTTHLDVDPKSNEFGTGCK